MNIVFLGLIIRLESSEATTSGHPPRATQAGIGTWARGEPSGIPGRGHRTEVTGRGPATGSGPGKESGPKFRAPNLETKQNKRKP